MNQFEMIAIIVVAVMIASVFKSRFSHRRRRDSGGDGDTVQEKAENLRLREEVKALTERLHVLERIAVEKEDSLSRQIEQLRDR